jgi:hypothetical protein
MAECDKATAFGLLGWETIVLAEHPDQVKFGATQVR